MDFRPEELRFSEAPGAGVRFSSLSSHALTWSPMLSRQLRVLKHLASTSHMLPDQQNDNQVEAAK